MLNKCIKFFIENKFIALLLLFIFVGFGLVYSPFSSDLDVLPSDPISVDAIPDLGENQQIVFTEWKGRSPQDIEDQITYPLTSALLGVPGVKTIRSSSMFGVSYVYIIFEEDIEFYWSRSRILEKLNSLPNGLLPFGVQPSLGPDATGLGQIFWYTLEGRDADGNVTGGWDLQELRSIQDYYVKYALSSSSGVAEVASIGGYVQEYQIDVNPELLKQYSIGLQEVVNAVKESNRDIGAQTLEINQAEYFVRGLGYIKSITDLENAVVRSKDYVSISIKDIAKISLGPASRRGILDKEGAEVVGGVVVARYGANPMEVIGKVKDKIKELSAGLPSKTLKDGTTSRLTVVPFYDRSELIKETLWTLKDALTLEVLITILVVLMMLFNLRASILISTLLPVAVLMVFIMMKVCEIDANIVALSGIAIAIGTMVDVGVILSENIIRHIKENRNGLPINTIVYNATSEVSSAILTAVLTTIISFVPVFMLIGAEGKLFRPLAFTKTMALIAAIVIALFLIPPFAAFLFKKRSIKKGMSYLIQFSLIILGFVGVLNHLYLGVVLVAFGLVQILYTTDKISKKIVNSIYIIISGLTIAFLLAVHWRPLGIDQNVFWNMIFVVLLCVGLLGSFFLFQKYYVYMLNWTLRNKLLFMSLPTTIVICGVIIFQSLGKEFMPSLNEGTFLLMPTSLPHAGADENKRVLQQLDMAVANIPEIETVVGKSGRVNSALDPAPLSMYENVIRYKPEFATNAEGKPQRFKINNEGLFELKNGSFVASPNATKEQLIHDENGAYFRNWRAHIKSTDDIWKEITKVTKLPGVTSAPKLQPIETRLIMLQTGMRSPMGIKVQGQDQKSIENFGLQLEIALREVKGIKTETVFADRVVGKPYLLIELDRNRIAKYGISVEKVQKELEVALGGRKISQTVERRERYDIRVRYPRELRTTPEDIKNIYIPIQQGTSVPLSELVTIRYEKGPEAIKSEDTFLVSYVLFDKVDEYAEIDVIQNAKELLQEKINSGVLIKPKGINYKFTGTYENQLRSEKSLSIIVPLTLLSIFLILYFQFRSITTSLMVFIGVIVSFAGGFLMIWLYGQAWFLDIDIFGDNLRSLFQIHKINLSVAVWVGFIALFGIATDDGVIMATYLKQTFKKNRPRTIKAIHDSVIQAGEKRIRPCLMTTATTILALLPILTSTGRGSDIMIPMAIPSFGGMFIALITLFVVPILFSWQQEFLLKKENRIEKDA